MRDLSIVSTGVCMFVTFKNMEGAALPAYMSVRCVQRVILEFRHSTIAGLLTTCTCSQL
jgi:hypothetical protein